MLNTVLADLEYGTYDIHEDRSQAVYQPKQKILGLESRGRELVFGIVANRRVSHLSYYLRRSLKPEDSLARIRSNPPDNQYFYFDAGGNGHPVRIHVDELERVYMVLDLIEPKVDS